MPRPEDIWTASDLQSIPLKDKAAERSGVTLRPSWGQLLHFLS